MKRHQKTNWRYLSPSQLWLWENDPDQFIRQYVYGEKPEPTEAMELGKKLALALETGECAGNPALEHILTFMPTFEAREYKLSVEVEGVPLYGKLDGFTLKPMIIDEVKTGTQYTQSKADKLDQVTFYTLMAYKKFGKLPERTRLHWAKTTRNGDGILELTGEIVTFETKRTMADILTLVPRLVRVWKEINEAVAKEYEALQ